MARLILDLAADSAPASRAPTSRDVDRSPVSSVRRLPSCLHLTNSPRPSDGLMRSEPTRRHGHSPGGCGPLSRSIVIAARTAASLGRGGSAATGSPRASC